MRRAVSLGVRRGVGVSVVLAVGVALVLLAEVGRVGSAPAADPAPLEDREAGSSIGATDYEPIREREPDGVPDVDRVLGREGETVADLFLWVKCDGRSAAHAEVEIAFADASGAVQRHRAEADAAGLVSCLGLRLDAEEVQVAARGTLDHASGLGHFPLGRGANHRELHLSRNGGGVFGVVRGASGPLPGVRVWVESKDWASRTQENQLTDERGRFRFSSLADGEWDVTIRPLGCVVRTSVTLSGREEDVGELVVPAEREVAGCVLDAPAEDEPPLSVRVTTESGRILGTGWTDGQGRFRFLVPDEGQQENWIELSLAGSGFRILREEITVPSSDLILSPSWPRGAIHGDVEGHRPGMDYEVWLVRNWRPQGAGTAGPLEVLNRVRCTSSAFELHHVPAGKYWVGVRCIGQELGDWREITLQDGPAEYPFRLGSSSLRIRTPIGSTLPARVSVRSLLSEDEVSFETGTGSSLEANLAPGPFRVEWTAEESTGLGTDSRTCEVRPDCGGEVVLEPRGSCAVTVSVEVCGTAPRGLEIQVFQGKGQRSRTYWSDEFGVARFDALSGATATLWIPAFGVAEQLPVLPGGEFDVRVSVSPTTDARCTVPGVTQVVVFDPTSARMNLRRLPCQGGRTQVVCDRSTSRVFLGLSDGTWIPGRVEWNQVPPQVGRCPSFWSTSNPVQSCHLERIGEWSVEQLFGGPFELAVEPIEPLTGSGARVSGVQPGDVIRVVWQSGEQESVVVQ